MDPSKGEPAEACDTAVALGATNIRVWARFGIDHTASEEERAEVTREVSGFADEAASRGLTVGIECHGWTLTDTAESTRRLVADVDAEHVYSYWQPNYWDPEVNRSPERQIDELDHMAADLSNLHVYWWHGMDRLALQEGADTWVPALALARRAGRWGGERFAFLEYVAGDDPDLLAREAATLRGWIGEGS
jgi:sugar phosphate isomerase/epimerase